MLGFNDEAIRKQDCAKDRLPGDGSIGAGWIGSAFLNDNSGPVSFRLGLNQNKFVFDVAYTRGIWFPAARGEFPPQVSK